MEPWHDFLVALAGASGALVGLLFVAMSLSIDQLLKASHLLSRAAACLELLAGVLILSCTLLIPNVDTQAAGWLILLVGIGIWLAVTLSSLHSLREAWTTFRVPAILAVTLFQLATLPQIVAGAGMFVVGDDALYLLAPAFMLAFAVAVFDSWVIMIEVRR